MIADANETSGIDACVAIKWFVRERHTDLALTLLEDEAASFIAPDIFASEVVNGLLKQSRHGQLSDELLDRALTEVARTMPALTPSLDLIGAATSFARTLRHPLYDCLYLALAQRWDAPLVTADVSFVKLCRAKLAGQSVNRHLRTLEEHVL